MSTPTPGPQKGGPRDLFFFTHPDRWPTWPFLPLMRRRAAGEEECGVLYDFVHTSGRTGYGATVFLSNLFLLPDTEEAFVALPKEVFDTPEELLAAGWTVD